ATAFEESVAKLEAAGFFSRRAEIPLTEGQRELWTLAQYSARANTACNETWTLHFDGPLDVEALRRSAQTIVDRHDALRSTFAASGEAVIVAPRVALEIPLADFSQLPAEESERRLGAMREAESGHVFPLDHGPLIALR